MQKILQTYFPHFSVKETKNIGGSKNSVAVFTLDSGEKKIIKKHSTTHNAASHEMKALRLFKNKKSFAVPNAIHQKKEHVVYDHLEHVKLSILDDDLILQIVSDITDEMDDIDINTLSETLCPMNDHRTKKKILSNLEDESLKDIKNYVYIKNFVRDFNEDSFNTHEVIHNDFDIKNILYSNETPYLIDWEAIFKFDRHVDYAIMYTSLYLKNKDLAEKYLKFLRQKNNFLEDKLIFIVFQNLISLIFDYSTKKNINVDRYKKILEELSYKFVGNTYVRPENMDKKILENISKSFYRENFSLEDHKKAKITHISNFRYNGSKEGIFLYDIPEKKDKVLIKQFVHEEDAKVDYFMSKQSHLFDNLTIPEFFHSERTYLGLPWKYYDGTESLAFALYNDTISLKETFSIIKSIVKDCKKATPHLQSLGERKHWHPKFYLLQYINEDPNFSDHAEYYLIKAFLETFDEDKIRRDQLIHQRLTTNKIRRNEKGEITVVDWFLASLFDVNFDYGFSFLSLSGRKNAKELMIESFSEDPDFDIYKIIYFGIERTLVASHFSDGNRYDFSAKKNYLNNLRTFVQRFEKEILQFVNQKGF